MYGVARYILCNTTYWHNVLKCKERYISHKNQFSEMKFIKNGLFSILGTRKNESGNFDRKNRSLVK